MNIIASIPENLQEACDQYWASPKRSDCKEKLLSCFKNGRSDECAELLGILKRSSDKDECNRAAGRLRTLAADFVDAFQKAIRSADMLASIGIDTAALHEQLRGGLLAAEYVRDRVAAPWIDQNDIQGAAEQIGVKKGDILLVHSAFSRLGHVIGGAQAVVDGLLAAIGEEGTLVMPTLSQKNFERAYEEWSLDRPSDVGYLTEFFRKLPGTERSDQQTHSVAAKGRLAHELTREHTAYGPRRCLFGDYAFSHSSPWQKMHDLGGKVLFLGAGAQYNTYKHFIECCQIERRLNAVKDPALRRELEDGLWKYEDFPRVVAHDKSKAYPLFPALAVTEVLDREGYVSHGKVGDADLLLMDIQTMVREMTRVLESDLGHWYPEAEAAWFGKADSYAGK